MPNSKKILDIIDKISSSIREVQIPVTSNNKIRLILRGFLINQYIALDNLDDIRKGTITNESLNEIKALLENLKANKLKIDTARDFNNELLLGSSEFNDFKGAVETSISTVNRLIVKLERAMVPDSVVSSRIESGFFPSNLPKPTAVDLLDSEFVDTQIKKLKAEIMGAGGYGKLTEQGLYAIEAKYLKSIFDKQKSRGFFIHHKADFFKFISSLCSEQARKELVEKVFVPMNANCFRFITNNFNQILSHFSNNPLFFKFIEGIAVKPGEVVGISEVLPDAKARLENLISHYKKTITHLLEEAKRMSGSIERNPMDPFLVKLSLPFNIPGSEDKYADVIVSDNRIFFTVINWMNIGNGEGVKFIEHPALKGKLEGIFQDRYDWSNFLGACRDMGEVDGMLEMIPVLFKNNPGLADRFNQATITELVQDVKDVMSTREMQAHIRKNKKENPTIFLNTFYREMYKRLFAVASESSLVIEAGCVLEDLEEQARLGGPVPEYMRCKDVLFQETNNDPTDFKGDDYYHQVLNCADSFVKFSFEYCRNENTGFLHMPDWEMLNMGGLSVMFDRDPRYTAVDHMVANIMGEHRDSIYVVNDLGQLESVSAKVCTPFVTGNCWDQAQIQLLHLALNGPSSSQAPQEKLYAYHVGNEYADHSYCIITSLSRNELQKKGCLKNDGTISMLKLFDVDRRAIISDPWAKDVFSYPILGLHYAEYPHNDTDQPKVPEDMQDRVGISSSCTIGESNSIQCYSQEATTAVQMKIRLFKSLPDNSPEKQRWKYLTTQVGDYISSAEEVLIRSQQLDSQRPEGFRAEDSARAAGVRRS